jgi:mRNA deadenylase 3'-5' endonuclease subunit Ccr4
MIMSYNVLAPYYCTLTKYPQSDPQITDWEVRRRQILDEITFYAPSFICLQVI